MLEAGLRERGRKGERRKRSEEELERPASGLDDERCLRPGARGLGYCIVLLMELFLAAGCDGRRYHLARAALANQRD